MAQPNIASLPEVFLTTRALSQTVRRGVADGKLRQIGPKLFTSNLSDTPERIIHRNLWSIIDLYVPGALIADRTAIENRPAKDGSIFVVADRTRDVSLAGVTIKTRPGTGPLPTDRRFVGKLYLSSEARAYLDNMVPSRARSGVSRTLSRAEIENRLDDIARRRGEQALNSLRDEAKRIAPALGREAEFEVLDGLIGAMMGTRDGELVTERAQARSVALQYDPDRVELFEKLRVALSLSQPPTLQAKPLDAEGQASLTFFESYFSNFIEGTEFEVDEAAGIVFENVIPSDRPKDAHDILSTWKLVSDPDEMRHVPTDETSFIELLKHRHSVLMGARPDMRPGEFKMAPNRAGQTQFVHPDQVVGTLMRGFEYYRSLDGAFARAVFMMFLVSEVHPFVDGNGRIARIMMNAELVAQDAERVIIPTIYRNNYLSALKAISLNGMPEPIIRTLEFARDWVASIGWSDLPATRAALEATNAFMDPGEADLEGARLRLAE